MTENKSDSARHTIAFQETMKRFIAEVEKQTDNAYIVCYETHLKRDSDCTGCPWVNEKYPEERTHPCKVMLIRGVLESKRDIVMRECPR
jgi:hypothetical protein